LGSGDAVKAFEQTPVANNGRRSDGLCEAAGVANLPLAGKTVAVVHAAWHSCGSYQVNVSQIAAYKALGARAISVAMMDVLSPPPPGGRWADYFAATRDLAADRRYCAAPPRSSLWTSALLKDGWWPLIHGDQARWSIELAKRAPLPLGVEAERIDLIHANHYFTLPLAQRLRGRGTAPIVVETQDIQARQYVLRNRSGFFLAPYASYEDMLAVELDWTGQADLCVHLNEEERREFEQLLPRARHALVYPAVAPVPLGGGGRNIVIVASDNYANFVSLRWFLNEVLPLAGDIPVSIYGNIDAGAKNRDKALYEAHRPLFKGRVADLSAVYANAASILLPTIEGHGLSIKAVEALSSGAPLIATPTAFRGMGVDPRTLANVTLREDAAGFAAALRETAARLRAGALPQDCANQDWANQDCANSDTRRLYDAVFSPRAYANALARIAVPLLGRQTTPGPANIRSQRNPTEQS
jgi:glycosyltransferase involved in cell wall biosynthesis